VNHFEYKKGDLNAEQVKLRLIAERFGTPAFVYSRATLERHYRVMDEALKGHPHLICYSVKACSNLGVLDVLARLGSGFDVVSEGELMRVRRAGGKMHKVVFSGVGKREDELRLALQLKIKCINVESEGELLLLEKVAKQQRLVAPISIRVNPNVDPKTHPYIATGMKEHKFGVPIERARELYQKARRSKWLEVRGVDCHIGSQLTETEPFIQALGTLLELVEELRGLGDELQHIDLGGGLGITYEDEAPPHPSIWGSSLKEALSMVPNLEVLIEPGRVIAGNAGILLTRVTYTKEQGDLRFVICDAGMNDLARPALYGAHHGIQRVHEASADEGLEEVEVVGPICESGDFLAHRRLLPPIKAGDLLAVMSAGAYGFAMSSNYNSRPRAPELLVDKHEVHLVRRRETIGDLMRQEAMPPRAPLPASQKRTNKQAPKRVKTSRVSAESAAKKKLSRPSATNANRGGRK